LNIVVERSDVEIETKGTKGSEGLCGFFTVIRVKKYLR
jgi:hypothetical protein